MIGKTKVSQLQTTKEGKKSVHRKEKNSFVNNQMNKSNMKLTLKMRFGNRKHIHLKYSTAVGINEHLHTCLCHINKTLCGSRSQSLRT